VLFDFISKIKNQKKSKASFASFCSLSSSLGDVAMSENERKKRASERNDRLVNKIKKGRLQAKKNSSLATATTLTVAVFHHQQSQQHPRTKTVEANRTFTPALTVEEEKPSFFSLFPLISEKKKKRKRSNA
jgi:hypothetical protein